jgi:cytochrome c
LNVKEQTMNEDGSQPQPARRGFLRMVSAGKAAFVRCSACHSVEGSNGAGPSQQGVVGRKAGSFAGFRYSRAMKAAAMTWDAALLDAYIADPQKVIPGNLMPFSGVPDATERADIVAYLATLK